MDLPPLLRRALVSGSAASVFSTAVLARQGRDELDDAAAPLNGPSQWVWGLHAPYRNGFSLSHTVVGFAIHHVASVFWALFYEKGRELRGPTTPAQDARLAVATAAGAAFVDYCLTPERLTPGFEKRLSIPSLVLVYGAFALGLAAASSAARMRSAVAGWVDT